MDNSIQHPFPRGLIQVAGVHDIEEARMLLSEGVDLIGLPLRLTVNQEDLSEEAAASLSISLPGQCCLITYLNTVDEIYSFTRELAVDFVQLHGPVDPGIMPELKRLLPSVRFIKSLVIGKGEFEDLISDAKEFSPHVWGFITDTFDPDSGAEGATGKIHDWDLSRKLVQLAEKPVILAGGLNPRNVSQAIRSVKPHGVDVHTGVEGIDGRKCRSLVKEFVTASISAFKAANP